MAEKSQVEKRIIEISEKHNTKRKDYNTANKEFEEVKQLLQKKPNGYNYPYIQRQLHEKETLRKVFLAVIKSNPARISEIFEESLLTKPTCYSQLHKLMDLHLVGRVYVMDIKEGVVSNKDIEKKFKEWVKTMPDKLKRYYLAKTSYWVITDFGKQFCKKAWEFEQEFREKEQKKEQEKNGEKKENG